MAHSASDVFKAETVYDIVTNLDRVDKLRHADQTSLMRVCMVDVDQKLRYEMACVLLAREAYTLSHIDNKGRTALMHACREGHYDIVELFVKWAPAFVDVVDCYGKTALIYICQRHDAPAKTVEVLLRCSRIPDHEDIYGNTALYYATCQLGRPDAPIVKLILGALGSDAEQYEYHTEV